MSRLDEFRVRRRGAGFNLAFLDIMACGLGAVILLFLIIKHNTDSGSVESEVLMTQLETMQRESERMQELIENVSRGNAQEQLLGDELQQRAQSSKTVLSALDERMTDQEIKSAQLREANKKTEAENAADLVQSAGLGEEQYFMGLLVEGPRIAILLDHSGSMTDEKLIDVFRHKVGSAAERKLAPKWLRARKTLKWLLNRVPDNSKVILVGFGERAEFLGAKRWFGLRDKDQVNQVLIATEALVPEGPTNLQAAFDQLAGISPPPTDIYLITDGLPTKVSTKLPGCAKGNTVSGACRRQLFGITATAARTTLGAFTLNVILFPLEGDWEAATLFWQMTGASGGLVISPPASWP